MLKVGPGNNSCHVASTAFAPRSEMCNLHYMAWISLPAMSSMNHVVDLSKLAVK